MAKSRARQWADLLASTPVALDNSNRLTVGDADTASATLDVATSSGNASVEIQAPSDSHSILKFGDTADDDVGHITYDHTADYMSFTANASERMRIDSSGNAGIGLTNPSTNLHVAGTVTATAFAGDGSSLTGIESLPAAIDVNGSAPDDSLVINSAGNVGIGTSSPTSKLSFGANIGLDFAVYEGAGGANKYGIGMGGAGTSPDPFRTKLYANGSESLSITSSGNVGIGTTSPDAQFHVSAPTAKIRVGATAGSEYLDIFRNSATGNIIYNSAQASFGAHVWQLSGSEKMRIDPSGNVGIGTSSPNSLLHLKSTGPAILTLEADSDNATETDNARIELSQDGGIVTGHMGYATNTNGISIWNNHSDYVRFGTSDTERMHIDSAGDVLPGANGTQDFGSTSLRWANIYTSDLHLNNGIGNYTIVEGEEDLFLYNNKNGKTYKFVLAEVDPSEAPKKMEK